MKITRGFTRKINLGNYETADFWAEYEDEYGGTMSEDYSEALYVSSKKDVEKSIHEFQATKLIDKLEARKKVAELELKNSKDEAKSNILKFQISLWKDEIDWLKGGK